ncbi:NlpC/P60 family protein [Pengzhenrongella frigida]|uniref:NlpC/P60 family protein n=2 Tax=Pengzhenrongella frigida TaxID=1259133 RepID=A0A4Q5MWH9_9MICO|nr:NlpC/P60 family protein [Cellulomonas sp. HLT2-17]
MTAVRAQNAATTTVSATTGASSTTSTSATETSFAEALIASLSLGATTAAGSTTAGSTTAAAGTGSASGQGLVDAAMAYVGVPYVWGGENPATGLDCSGLVQRAMADLGVDVPRVARDQATLGTAVASLDAAKPGDLLIFDGGSHIGIYLGDGRMIDAPKPGKSVAVRDVFETPTAIRRVLPEASAASAVSATAAVTDAGTSSLTTDAGTSSLTSAVDLQRYALTMMSEGVAA